MSGTSELKTFLLIRFMLLFMVSLFAASSSSCQSSIEQRLKDLDQERKVFEKRIKEIKNDSLKNEIETFGRLYFFLKEMGIENSKIPEKTSYDDNPFDVLKNYKSSEDMIQNYINSLFIDIYMEMSDEQGLRLMVPFNLPIKYSIAFDSIQFESGKSFPVINEDLYSPNATGKFAVVKSNNLLSNDIKVLYTQLTEEKEKPIKAKARFNAYAPKNILEFRFKKSDVGKSIKKEGFTVMLEGLENHIVKVSVDNPFTLDEKVKEENLDWVDIQASDHTKLMLNQTGSQSGSDGLIDFYKSLLDFMLKKSKESKDFTKDVEKMNNDYYEKYENQYFKTAYFEGMPEEIVVYVLDYSELDSSSRHLELDVIDLNQSPNETLKEIKVAGIVYDNGLENKLAKLEVKAEELQKELTLKKSNTTVYVSDTEDYGEPEYYSLDFPNLMSKTFFEGTRRERFPLLKTITFKDKEGKRIFVPEPTPSDNYSEPAPFVKLLGEGIVFYPSKLPVVPHSMAGTVEVAIAEISKNSIKVESLPDGINVSGNRVMVNTLIFDENDISLFAKDKNGMYLKLLHQQKHYDEGQSIYSIVYYFYGNPAILELYQLTGTKNVNYNFDLVLEKIQPRL